MIDWLKMMVGNRKSEDVVDPKLPEEPPSKALKRVMLVALRCVDPDALKRPKIGYILSMLESENLLTPEVHLKVSSVLIIFDPKKRKRKMMWMILLLQDRCIAQESSSFVREINQSGPELGVTQSNTVISSTSEVDSHRYHNLPPRRR